MRPPARTGNGCAEVAPDPLQAATIRRRAVRIRDKPAHPRPFPIATKLARPTVDRRGQSLKTPLAIFRPGCADRRRNRRHQIQLAFEPSPPVPLPLWQASGTRSNGTDLALTSDPSPAVAGEGSAPHRKRNEEPTRGDACAPALSGLRRGSPRVAPLQRRWPTIRPGGRRELGGGGIGCVVRLRDRASPRQLRSR